MGAASFGEYGNKVWEAGTRGVDGPYAGVDLLLWIENRGESVGAWQTQRNIESGETVVSDNVSSGQSRRLL